MSKYVDISNIPLFTKVRGVFKPIVTSDLAPGVAEAIGHEFVFMVVQPYDSGSYEGADRLDIHDWNPSIPFHHTPACDVEIIEIIQGGHP